MVMIKMRHTLCLSVLALVLSLRCQKPYTPPAIAFPGSYLVVDGIINSGNDSTIFLLSRTVNTNAKTTANPILDASVLVESDAGASWPLNSNGAGRYVSGPLGLSASQKYRIHISTGDGLQYLSDFVPVKPTPPIDSIGYNITNGILQLYVNAHDATDNTHYYRWDYAETWQFHTEYVSYLYVDSVTHQIAIRLADKYIFNCFGNDLSTDVLLASTTNLGSDIVYQNILTRIALSSEKLETKYSVLVRQYALTAEAFQFYTILKKNTEELGGLFGPLPSQLTGNIHCVNNPNIPVIGYITATNIQSKRVFISEGALPPTQTIYPYTCQLDTSTIDLFFKYPGIYTPIEEDNVHIYYSTSECVDCTIRGTTQTPSFWK